MKKILLSAGMIIFIGTIAAGATGAFFNDTETSTGNVFTAGGIDLTVDSTQHYNNAVCVAGANGSTWQLAPGAATTTDQYPIIGSPCTGTWTATNLGPSFQFFNFADVKPGDQGEDTVSLHLESNPAYACVDIGTTGNNENSLLEPESAAGDTSSTTGELAQEVHVFAWLDNASTSNAQIGDNIFQAGEPILQQPIALSALGTTTLTLADGGTGTTLPGGSTTYIGLGWCAGTLTVGTSSWACDGSTMGNEAQTDSATSTVQFRVEQARNNSAFRCSTTTAPVAVPVSNPAS
jgi:Ca-activated chloride channel homolog